MNKNITNNSFNRVVQFPWCDITLESILNTELQYAEESVTNPEISAHPVIDWIYRNGLEAELRSTLQEAAPLISFSHPVAETWIAPPLSGAGNTVVIAWNADRNGVRTTGWTNWGSRPTRAGNDHSKCAALLRKYNTTTVSHQKRDLLQEALQEALTSEELQISNEVVKWCRRFRTMPVYLLAVDSDGARVGAFPAVLHGKRFCDFSAEKVGGSNHV